jgi:hypothetical protein
MNIKIDWQHVVLVLIAGLTSFGPMVFAGLSQGTLGKAAAVLGPCVAVLNTLLAIMKASIVQPAQALPAAPEGK